MSRQEARERVSWFLAGEGQHQIVSVNPEGVLLAQKNERYCEVLNRASLALADGFGIILASLVFRDPKYYDRTICNQKIRRFAGIDLMLALCEAASKNGWRVYLIGGEGETASRAAQKLRGIFSGLMIEGEEGIPVGGNFQFPISNFQSNTKIQNPKSKMTRSVTLSEVEGSPANASEHTLEIPRQARNDEVNELINRINKFQPRLLFVALGQPRQELWIDAHLGEMPSVRVAMGVGGAFDVISGKIPRAPFFMRRMGIEWLWRLAVQPWRLPRIFNATVRFGWLIVREYLTRHSRAGGKPEKTKT